MKIARLVGIFALGIVAGAIVMAYLARHASLKYAQAMEISYAFEQQRIAATAVKEGRWQVAASAYRNVAAAEGSPEKPFGIERLEWDVFFPIASLALEPMPAASDPQGGGRRKLAAIYTAMHAYALEQSGHVSEADRAWTNAMKFGALKSVEEARSTARRLIDQDVEAFTGARSQ